MTSEHIPYKYTTATCTICFNVFVGCNFHHFECDGLYHVLNQVIGTGGNMLEAVKNIVHVHMYVCMYTLTFFSKVMCMEIYN